MDAIQQYGPLVGGLLVPIIMVMYKAAEATPERNKQVCMWVIELLLFSFLCSALAWFGYQCISFMLSAAPLTRMAVGLFAMSLINIWLYGWLIVTHIERRLSKKAAIEKLQKEKARLSEEVLDAREARLRAQMRADTAEALLDFARQLVGDTKK
jgi:hypothetical protein